MNQSFTANRNTRLGLLACLALASLVAVSCGFVAAKEDEQTVVARFKNMLAEKLAEIDAGLESGDYSKNEAWAHWWNFHRGEFRPALLEYSEGGAFSNGADIELWQAIESAEFTARVNAVVARGLLTEEEGKQRLETFKNTGNPIVFEILGDLFTIHADEAIGEAIDRFDAEIADRSDAENQLKILTLTTDYNEAKAEGDQARANLLALEIRRISSIGLDLNSFDFEVLGHAFVIDPAEPGRMPMIKRIQTETENRTPEENKSKLETLTAAFKAAQESGDEKQLVDLAAEFILVQEALKSE